VAHHAPSRHVLRSLQPALDVVVVPEHSQSSTSRNTLPNSPSRLLIALAKRLQISVILSMAGPMLHHHGSPITGSRPVEASWRP